MKKWLWIVTVNLVVLLALIALLEAIFGAWVRDDSLNRLNLVRDRTLQFSTSELYRSASGIAVYTRDEYGLRGEFGGPSEIDLLTVGGSTTDQRFISDDLTWQSVMQRELAAHGTRVTIANAGVDGQSTVGHIRAFEWWFPKVEGLRPAVILFYIGINDFYRRRTVDYDDLQTEKSKRSLRQRLRESSAIYHMAYTLYGMYQAEVKHNAGHARVDFSAMQWTDSPLRQDHRTLMEPYLDAYRGRVELLGRLAVEMGATPVFVTQPTRWHRVRDGVEQGVSESSEFGGVEINGLDRHKMLRLLDMETCGVAEARGWVCVDMGAVDSWSDDDFYDFAHMTPTGTQKLGVALADHLAGVISSQRGM